ncbi:MAG: hypothetical protein K2Y56_23455 [Methylobacterium sp.]|uniref:head-tail connector protein n=1 Tax=Methylobacterium sp. TaxID=409 RepID=UPI0025DE00ED|nr:hypothetical protein [Methylobacterium sp.]MBX9934434.1 hypothetical protein [Methylobacterium sp.]
MTPIRLDADPVEPVSVQEMRAFLRLDSGDPGAEDPLLAGLVASARAVVEAATRRVLAPGRYRILLDAWPVGGWLPLPLSPLVAIRQAALVDADGAVTELAAGLLRLGPDPIEAPGLLVTNGVPALKEQGVLIEVEAGHGGDGPPLPMPLAQAIRLLAAQAFEHRGDEPGPEALPPMVAALIAPWRRLRL